jgi:hypothetical protein
MWDLKLPAAPVDDGVAVAADGTCVLALKDGSVIHVGSR